MRRILFNISLAIIALWFSAERAGAQDKSGMDMDMDMGPSSPFHFSAQAIGLVTAAWPTAAQRRLTEGYVTQPFVMAMFRMPGGWLSANATANLEGLTLKRGELTSGIWGEGYIDRRHPHTYIHELVLSAQLPARNDFSASVSAGKGFVPFGTDDPMMRPLVKYPVNHHLSQILERLVTIVGARKGPLVFEYSRFGGDEPQSPDDQPNLKRFGDSWSTRSTFHPTMNLELQSSYAAVVSPENASGGGQDQKKFNVSARYGGAPYYALVEFARTTDESHGKSSAILRSALAEAAFTKNGITASGRIEVTERPDEERLANPFRTPVPVTDFHISGISRWPVVSAGLNGRRMKLASLSFVPLLEGSLARPVATIPNSVFDPRRYYGASTLWNISAGIKLLVGGRHSRMGRYGVLAEP